MTEEIANRIKVNQETYERLLKDENYTEIKFNPKNGALSAIHKAHNFDPTKGAFGIARGEYERISFDVLYKYGNSVIMESENLGVGKKAPEGLLNGKRFDIKGIEGVGKNNIINNIKDANRKNVESVVLYYHDKDMFSKQQVQESYKSYYRNSKSKRIKHVYYIVDGKLHKL